jgi:hypothetical protein
MGFHPDSSMSRVNATAGFATLNGNQTGGASFVDVPVLDTTIFEAGDVVYIEDDTDSDPANWVREVLHVISVNSTASTIRLNLNGQDTGGGASNYESVGRGQSFADNSRIYNRGIQFLIREFTITDWEPVGGVKEKIYQRIPFRVGSWVGQHPNQGAGFEYPAVGYLVR